MKILVLGGIHEAKGLAHALHHAGHDVTYSVAGLGQLPTLPCPVRNGGFGGVSGLAEFLRVQRIELIVDATHPYAAQMSANAATAGAAASVPVWAYRRPAWVPTSADRWTSVPDWPAAQHAIAAYQRPFITLGGSALGQVSEIPPGQQWLWRALPSDALPVRPRLTILGVRGPFNLEDELALLREQAVDVLVCKNSGGTAVAAKLAAARQLGLPVVMIARAPLPSVTCEFPHIEHLLQALDVELAP